MLMLRGALRERAGLIAVAATIAGLALPGTAWGVAQPIVAGDNFFTLPSYTMDQGERPAFQNAGSNPHNATSTQSGPDGSFLFRSPTITGGTTLVNGPQYLTQGNYPFICTVHPFMQATLLVTGNGTPVPRPAIDVRILSRKLAKVVSKGKLVVLVRALTTSNDVSVAATRGKQILGQRTDLDLAAGQKRKLPLKLKKGVRRKLAKKSKAKVKALATVPFGAPDRAKRVLK